MSGVPDGWRMVKLADVADTALGKMLDAARPKGDLRVPYLRNVNVQWGRVDLADVLEVPLSSDEVERFSLTAGDLLVCEGGEIGRAAIWSGGSTYMAYQKALHRIRSRGELDLRYLRYLLEHYANTGALAARATGSTIQHLPQQQLRELPVPFPDTTVQTRIVEILEDHLSRLDAAASSLEVASRRLRLLVTSATEAVRNEAAEIGPEASLGSLAVASGYGTSAKCVANGPGPAVVRIPNLVRGSIDLSDEKRVQDGSLDLLGLMLDPGDLLFVRTNGSRDLIGRTGVVQEGVRAAFASYLIRYKLDVARMRPQWVHLMMQTPGSRRLLESMAASSAGQYNLSLSKLDRVAVPVPTLDEQDRLLARSRGIEEAAGRLYRDLTSANARRTALRRSLLTAAFAGRLTGRTEDDEIVEELASV